MNNILKVSLVTICNRLVSYNTCSRVYRSLLHVRGKHNLILNYLSIKRSFSTNNNLLSDTSIPLTKLDTKKLLSFICKKCEHRNTKFISKQAYEKGVVIVRCDGCQNNHLIADNLNWFQLGNVRNVEDILREKGEKVMKELSHDGSLEVILNDKKSDA